MGDSSILIVGSGFGGLGLGIRLKKAGIHDFTILEQADDVGGTWRDNQYPGAACDVQSHLYSYSFERNPTWTRTFAPQREILSYLRRCADKYGVRSHIRFGTEVTSARFDERSNTWAVSTTRGLFRARVLVSATGGLCRPMYPNIEGAESFGGKAFHSARWYNACSLHGKTVGVIGTGASAIQIVPAIASQVNRLVLFQRTAPWVLPKPDYPISEKWRMLFRRIPFLGWFLRIFLYWTLELRVLAFLHFPGLMKYVTRAATDHIARSISDPGMRTKLTPDYTIGCKRILMSNEYYQALAKPNAEVVTDGIERIVADGVVTADGRHHACDAIVYATGFKTGDDGPAFEIRGLGGMSLEERWKDGAMAYLSATVPDFPNLFFLCGPNSGLSHSSMVFMLESSMSYVIDAVRTMRVRRIERVSVKADVFTRYNEDIQRRFPGTVWSSGCKSWYQTGSGKNVAIWPGFTFQYRSLTKHFRLRDYEIVAQRSEALTSACADASISP